MKATAEESIQRQLFVLNRSVLDNAEDYARLLELERGWITSLLSEHEARSPRFSSRPELMQALDEMLKHEENNPTESAIFLAEHATREQFRKVVQQFAVDGLTEAQSFFPIIMRLPARAQMPMMRIVIDEFGCGNPEQAHSLLYQELLAELALPPDCDSYLPLTNDESFAFVNIFYWMAHRARHPEYFLGALTYLENSIPYAFASFAQACHRLGVSKHHYYTEHLHIDGFHARETRNVLRELDTHGGLNCTSAWIGMQVASLLVGRALDAAVASALRSDPE